MKLCFSSSKSMNGAWNNATTEGVVEKENDVVGIKEDGVY